MTALIIMGVVVFSIIMGGVLYYLLEDDGRYY